MSIPITIEAASLIPPAGLTELLRELGNGEAGFGGTPFGRDEISLEEYLVRCIMEGDPSTISPPRVPQTTYWVLNREVVCIGVVRVRHTLNENLKYRGGHIGFYLSPSHRGNGYAKTIMQLALAELRALGETQALLTVNSDNLPSLKTIESCGGKMASVGFDEASGKEFRRYWVDLGSLPF